MDRVLSRPRMAKKLEIGTKEYAALATLVGRIDLFSPLTMAQMEKLLAYVMLYAYAEGETVFKRGEIGDAFYIVLSGRVSVRIKKGLLSLPRTAAVLGPGEFFGEIALISKEPRNAGIRCLEDSRLFVLPADSFGLLLRENPQASAEIRRLAVQRSFDSRR